MPNLINLNMQNSNSPTMELITELNDFIMCLMVGIMICVSIFLLNNMPTMINNMVLENHKIETLWTLSPTIILMMIGVPSIKSLYINESMSTNMINVKVIGHQWFWSYEYQNLSNKEISSFMKKDEKIMRLINVDNSMVLPKNISIRLLISSADVLHSWALPSMGLKVDATPGRINQINFLSKRTGIFVGQCSEICGMNHSFMPITLEILDIKYFNKWLMN